MTTKSSTLSMTGAVLVKDKQVTGDRPLNVHTTKTEIEDNVDS